MDGHGGRRSHAGRKAGAVTRRTRERADQIAKKGISPLDYLLAVMTDETLPAERRDNAARSALPFCHPRINPIGPKPESGAADVNTHFSVNIVSIPSGQFLSKEEIAGLSAHSQPVPLEWSPLRVIDSEVNIEADDSSLVNNATPDEAA